MLVELILTNKVTLAVSRLGEDMNDLVDPFSAAKALGDEQCGENACGDTAGLVGVEFGVDVPAGL